MAICTGEANCPVPLPSDPHFLRKTHSSDICLLLVGCSCSCCWSSFWSLITVGLNANTILPLSSSNELVVKRNDENNNIKERTKILLDFTYFEI